MGSTRRQRLLRPSVCLILLLVALPATAALGQEEKRPPEPPPGRNVEIPDFRGPTTPFGNPLPPSSVIDIKSPIAQLKENLTLLREIDDSMVVKLRSSPIPDYEAIIVDASDIRKLSFTLFTGLSLPKPEPAPKDNYSNASVSERELRDAIAALDKAVLKFLDNRVVKARGTVNAEELSSAEDDLKAILDRSLVVRNAAEYLSNASVGKKTSKSKRPKSRLAPQTAIVLNIDCDVWSVSDVLNKSFTLKNKSGIDINGIRVLTKSYQLGAPLLLPIDNCVDREPEGNAGGTKYVAIVKGFESFQVRDKVFAYLITYQIGLSKESAVEKRYGWVWFYYVDQAGTGEFDLFRGTMHFGFLPEWARELVKKKEFAGVR